MSLCAELFVYVPGGKCNVNKYDMQEKLCILWQYKKILLNWIYVCGMNITYF